MPIYGSWSTVIGASTVLIPGASTSCTLLYVDSGIASRRELRYTEDYIGECGVVHGYPGFSAKGLAFYFVAYIHYFLYSLVSALLALTSLT